MSGVDMYLSESRDQASRVEDMAQSQHYVYAGMLQAVRDVVDDTELRGKAYDSAKDYFSQVLLPLIRGGELLSEAVADAVRRFPEEYVERVDTIDLRQGVLEEQIQAMRLRIAGMQALRDDIAAADLSEECKAAALRSKDGTIADLERVLAELEAKLERLMAFDASSPSIFSDIQALHAAVDTGLGQTRTAWNAETGTFTIPGDRSWVAVIESYQHSQVHAGIYDEDGPYGGDQGSPLARYEADDYASFARIIRRYHPHMTDDEIESFLFKLKSEGCGYVALANTFFHNYRGSEEEFEETFGFPMYREENGEKILNIDDLVVDLYASQDNHNPVPVPPTFTWVDVNIPFEDFMRDKQGNVKDTGILTNWQGEYRLKRYMDAHGVDVDVSGGPIGIPATVANYDKYKDRGDVIVSIYPTRLEKENGEEAKNDWSGGHAMTVTGTSGDGRLVVSSWGKRYYVDPTRVVATFQVISYP